MMAGNSADDFDATITEELATLDAEMLAREGPDALTSDRAARLAQFRAAQATERQTSLQHAEQDFDRVGFILATFRRQCGWSAEALADWLGIEPDDYARLAGQIRPRCVRRDLTHDPVPIAALAERFGVHPERLYEAFDRGDP